MRPARPRCWASSAASVRWDGARRLLTAVGVAGSDGFLLWHAQAHQLGS
jgi:hypothetical protein